MTALHPDVVRPTAGTGFGAGFAGHSWEFLGNRNSSECPEMWDLYAECFAFGRFCRWLHDVKREERKAGLFEMLRPSIRAARHHIEFATQALAICDDYEDFEVLDSRLTEAHDALLAVEEEME